VLALEASAPRKLLLARVRGRTGWEQAQGLNSGRRRAPLAGNRTPTLTRAESRKSVLAEDPGRDGPKGWAASRQSYGGSAGRRISWF
jgi:hypothetical protein